MGLTEGDTRSLDDNSCYLSNSGVHNQTPNYIKGKPNKGP